MSMLHCNNVQREEKKKKKGATYIVLSFLSPSDIEGTDKVNVLLLRSHILIQERLVFCGDGDSR